MGQELVTSRIETNREEWDRQDTKAISLPDDN